MANNDMIVLAGADEGFSELDSQIEEGEAMDFAIVSVDQLGCCVEDDEVLSSPEPMVYFKDDNPGLQGRDIALDELEQLKATGAYQRRINTCHLCGQCWYDGKTTSSCAECGGFTLHCPCPLCGGKCHREWRRNVKQSHSYHVAYWDGSCGLIPTTITTTTTNTGHTVINYSGVLPATSQTGPDRRRVTDPVEECNLSEGLQYLSTS